MYDLKDGREVIIRNNISDFIEGVILMKDDDLRYKLSMNTAEFSKREFHPDVIEDKLRDILSFVFQN